MNSEEQVLEELQELANRPAQSGSKVEDYCREMAQDILETEKKRGIAIVGGSPVGQSVLSNNGVLNEQLEMAHEREQVRELLDLPNDQFDVVIDSMAQHVDGFTRAPSGRLIPPRGMVGKTKKQSAKNKAQKKARKANRKRK